MNLEQKLALYFFDPLKGEEEYAKEYEANCELPVAYSPLYLLRRQILLLTGKLIPFPNPPIGQTPYFSAILLAHIAVKRLTMFTSGKEYVHYKEYLVFYNKYLGLNELEYAAARLLRNGIEHNNFQLYMRMKADSAPMYNSFADHFARKGIITRKQLKDVKNFNVVFSMIETGHTGRVVSDPILIDFDQKSGIAKIQFYIQPYLFLEAFENGAKKVEEDILASKDLQKHFDRLVQEDNWMDVHE